MRRKDRSASHEESKKKSDISRPSFRQKLRKRLGGGGLGLEAFVAAKSKPTANPAQLRERRELYQNAKKVQQYRKLVKQASEPAGEIRPREVKLGGQELDCRPSEIPVLVEDGQDVPLFRKRRASEEPCRGPAKHHRKGNRTSQLERMSVKFAKKKLEEEMEWRKKQALFAEQDEARRKAQIQRKESRCTMRKVTQRGQPVMKHRMEQILETIQRQS